MEPLMRYLTVIMLQEEGEHKKLELFLDLT